MITDNSFTVSHIDSLFREAHSTSRDVISAHLSAVGFDDISSDESLILQAIDIGAESALRLLQTVGISEPETGELISALARHGYLDLQPRPGGGRSRIAITERGRAAIEAALNGFRAARWRDFKFRPGDIVVSTWPKTGTAWVQTICALLIFHTPDLPAPLAKLSPWLDLPRIPRDEVYAQLAAQEHRRIIKTHLPLSQIPVDTRATYITVGRNPLDSALSLYHQNNNKGAAPAEREVSQRPGQRRQQTVSEREWLLHWIDMEPQRSRYHYLAEMLRQLSAAWSRRHEPNVILLHYDDLSADLAGEMRRLAARLDIEIPDAIWPRLVSAATFKHMRADPDMFLTSGVTLKDNAAFFRRGVSGEGRGLLTPAELARYLALVAGLAPADLLAWLHRDEGGE